MMIPLGVAGLVQPSITLVALRVTAVKFAGSVGTEWREKDKM